MIQKKISQKTTVLFSILLTLFYACTKVAVNQDKEIISITLKKKDSSLVSLSVPVLIKNDSIYITLPAGTDWNHLVPQISFKGVSISPASGKMQDFSKPVKYTVTAVDSSKKTYTFFASFGAVFNSIYFGSSNNQFYALDATTGILKWQYNGTNWFSYTTPSYNYGTIYTGSLDSCIYAFEAKTGNVLWKYKTNGSIESNVVCVEGSVYAGSNDGYIYAIDAFEGSLRWKYQGGGNISSGPAIANNTIYFGCNDHYVYALDASTGNVKWSFLTSAMINHSSPCINNNVIYVGNSNGFLYAIDATTGSQKWIYDNGGISLDHSKPYVNGNSLYIGGWYDYSNFNLKGALYSINTINGSLNWRALPNTGFSSDPIVSNDKVYISGDDGNLSVLDATTGAVLWQKQILPNGASACVATNGFVYIGGGGNANFYALDATTGNQMWKYSIPGGLSNSTPLFVQ